METLETAQTEIADLRRQLQEAEDLAELRQGEKEELQAQLDTANRWVDDLEKQCLVEAEREDFERRISELDLALEHARQLLENSAQTWQSIEELNGDHDTGAILLWCPAEACRHQVGCRDEGSWLSDGTCLELAPTHWQPLPNGPEAGR